MKELSVALIMFFLLTTAAFPQNAEEGEGEEESPQISFLLDETVNYTYSVGESMLVVQDDSGIVNGLGLPAESITESMVKLNFSQAQTDWVGAIVVYETPPEGEEGEGVQPYRPPYPLEDASAMKIVFTEAMQTWVINGTPIPPMVSVDSMLRNKELYYTYDERGKPLDVYNLDEVIKEFSPIDINCLLLMLQPPVEQLLDESTWETGVEVNLAFPRTWDRKLSLSEKLLATYTYVGDSFWQELPCYVFSVDFYIEELTVSETSISSTFAQGEGGGSGTIMWSPETNCTLWAEVEFYLDRVKQLNLKQNQYIIVEKAGSVHSLVRETPVSELEGTGEGEEEVEEKASVY